MESKFNISKVNENVDGSFDYGIFQINSHYWCNDYQSHSENFCRTDCQGLVGSPRVGEMRRLGSTYRAFLPRHCLAMSFQGWFKEQGIP